MKLAPHNPSLQKSREPKLILERFIYTLLKAEIFMLAAKL